MDIHTDMDTHIITIKKMIIDIHNHSLPQVDDGSQNYSMTKKMLYLSKQQKVSKVFLTPHINSSVSKKNRADQLKIFHNIKKLESEIGIKIFLGAEIYIPFRLPEIDFSDYCMGETNVLLLEFSVYHETPITEHCFNLLKRGYSIIIAHLERYSYLKDEEIIELKEMGVHFQVNASSLLEKNKSGYKIAKKLMKMNLIDFVASDTHNLTTRNNRILEAFNFVQKKFGLDRARNLFFENQEKLLFI